MTRKILAFMAMIFWLPAITPAASSDVKLEQPHYNFDRKTILRGAQIFNKYCLGCHGAKYMRYDRIVTDLDVDKTHARTSFIPPGAKLTNTITPGMAPKDAEAVFGVIPPDLSMVGRSRGPAWLYSYLRGFYKDTGRPSGWNNHVRPMVAMPNAFASLQGTLDQNGKVIEPGSISKEEFDKTVADLVAFLDYLAEPAKLQRLQLGWYVLGFLAIFTLLAYMLKREYWKDVH